MKATEILEMYKQGMITASQSILECLNLSDPENPGTVLREFPHELWEQLHEFSAGYSREQMVTNFGAVPSTDQVRAAREWIERARRNVG